MSSTGILLKRSCLKAESAWQSPKTIISLWKKTFFPHFSFIPTSERESRADTESFYVAANQCLRGMVTGCDNLLDDEYKMTLGTDLPLMAGSSDPILDIMVSDRVLFEILLDFCRSNGVSTVRAYRGQQGLTDCIDPQWCPGSI